jgi:hypothetical protein
MLPADLLLYTKLMLQTQSSKMHSLATARCPARYNQHDQCFNSEQQRVVRMNMLIVTDNVPIYTSDYRSGVLLPLREPTGKGEGLQLGSVMDGCQSQVVLTLSNKD